MTEDVQNEETPEEVVAPVQEEVVQEEVVESTATEVAEGAVEEAATAATAADELTLGFWCSCRCNRRSSSLC